MYNFHRLYTEETSMRTNVVIDDRLMEAALKLSLSQKEGYDTGMPSDRISLYESTN